MLGRAIWNKIPECLFEKFEMAREGDLSQKLPEPNM